jgi:hypothetical protein
VVNAVQAAVPIGHARETLRQEVPEGARPMGQMSGAGIDRVGVQVRPLVVREDRKELSAFDRRIYDEARPHDDAVAVLRRLPQAVIGGTIQRAWCQKALASERRLLPHLGLPDTRSGRSVAMATSIAIAMATRKTQVLVVAGDPPVPVNHNADGIAVNGLLIRKNLQPGSRTEPPTGAP